VEGAPLSASIGSGRSVDPVMRLALYVGSVLVSLAGVALYVLTDHTDDLFAWTIAAPNTAAFLGAFYWTALPLAFLSAREATWERARVGIPGVLVFLWGTLAATLLHLEIFHFDRPEFLPSAAAWSWLAIYALDPVLVSLGLFRQARVPGHDRPRGTPLPKAYTLVQVAEAVVVLFVGASMFAVPAWVAGWWPWPLTPLTSRSMAAWLLGFGVVLLTATWENDWRRIRNATIAHTVLGVLQLVALVRYPDALDWSAPAAWMYVAFFALVLLHGAYGWRRATTSTGSPAVA
jgi:hypothetical protein